MSRLPDLEAWAIFAKLAENGSFTGAASELGLSVATVSKAITRLEQRVGAALLNRTSRRVVLTELGRLMARNATDMLVSAEMMEVEAQSQTSTPAGLIRLAVPMSFGLKHVCPLLPKLMEQYPELSVDLHLDDSLVDLIGNRFDLALRIAALADSSLRQRRICDMRRLLVGSPKYFEKHGRPETPQDLAHHECLGYAYLPTPGTWRFVNQKSGENVSVVPHGRLRANNGDALTESLRAGLGIAIQPEFTVWEDLQSGKLEAVMTEWSLPDIALNVVMPPGVLRPARVMVVTEFLVEHLHKEPWAYCAQVEQTQPTYAKNNK